MVVTGASFSGFALPVTLDVRDSTISDRIGQSGSRCFKAPSLGKSTRVLKGEPVKTSVFLNCSRMALLIIKTV